MAPCVSSPTGICRLRSCWKLPTTSAETARNASFSSPSGVWTDGVVAQSQDIGRDRRVARRAFRCCDRDDARRSQGRDRRRRDDRDRGARFLLRGSPRGDKCRAAGRGDARRNRRTGRRASSEALAGPTKACATRQKRQSPAGEEDGHQACRRSEGIETGRDRPCRCDADPFASPGGNADTAGRGFAHRTFRGFAEQGGRSECRSIARGTAIHLIVAGRSLRDRAGAAADRRPCRAGHRKLGIGGRIAIRGGSCRAADATSGDHAACSCNPGGHRHCRAGNRSRPTAGRNHTPSNRSRPAAVTPAHAAETIEAEPEERPIPVPIARPPQPQDERNRAEARERQTVKKKKEAVEKQQVANVARGNADRNARAGDASGRETSKAKTGGGQSGGKASNAGNASASNYPGKVYAKIRRTRQKRAGGRGVAQIRFSISSSGGLASIRLASSSGSGAVDSAALDHIRRSAPFPPPPAGAQRQFVIPVEVRR